MPSSGASDDDLLQSIRDYLTAEPLSPTRAVWASVKGTNERISALLKAHFDCINGKRGAKLWLNPAESVATDSQACDESPNQSGANHHGQAV